MPEIIDYPQVLETMQARGLRCLYYNSGAFGFGDDRPVRIVGWIGPDDPSIRPALRPLTRSVPAPYEQNLADLLVRVWNRYLPGPLWAMPKSHWAYELDHGSRDWMPSLLDSLGIAAQQLAPLTNAAAIAFEPSDAAALRHFAQTLLVRLSESDFMLAFPGHPVLCTLHHHKQLWWQTPDESLEQLIDTTAAPDLT